MLIELLIGAIKAIVVVLVVLNLTALMLWFERKGAALIRIVSARIERTSSGSASALECQILA